MLSCTPVWPAGCNAPPHSSAGTLEQPAAAHRKADALAGPHHQGYRTLGTHPAAKALLLIQEWAV